MDFNAREANASINGREKVHLAGLVAGAGSAKTGAVTDPRPVVLPRPSQISRLKRSLDGLLADALDAVGSRIRAGTDDTGQLAPHEMQGRPVIGGEAGEKAPSGNKPMIRRPSFLLTVIVRTGTALEKPQAGRQGCRPPPE
jgi:hypothetical protein